ncbi:MAG: methyltransferase domain-containing protein [Deltaproteobacteria bacterium]|nr:methyltransferase domain-containing protein [Deltaproteobacteria bacterium]MCB9787559.1 methyltransferase domain-containing protein [Deltaproteobacteria bacterium]
MSAPPAPRPPPALRPAELLALTLVLSFCSIVYEFLIARALVSLTGEIVLWQSVTIGIYIAALGLGTWLAGRADPSQRTHTLQRVEIGLSLLGGLAIVVIFLAHVAYRIWFYDFTATMHLATTGHARPLTDPLVLFALACQLVTVAVGVLSGYELPILIELYSARLGRDGTDRVLGMSYAGTLVGSLAFGLLLVPRLDLLGTGLVVAATNLVAAGWLSLRGVERRRRVPGLLALLPVLAVLVAVVVWQRDLTQLLLKNFYYNFPVPTDLGGLGPRLEQKPDVHRIRTHYQDIDVVWDAHMQSRPDLGLIDLTLFLNGHYQLSALDERTYHEALVHVPTLLTGKAPRRALVLGAGDGLLVRELLRYGDRVEHVVQVELDPQMIALARRDRWMRQLNGASLDDPRVEVVVDDAFVFLRSHESQYDAIFIDFPYPYDYELSKLYSVEMFRAVLAHLAPDGYAVFDYPLLSADKGPRARQRNTAIMSTVAAAGFALRFPFGDDAETFVLIARDPRSLALDARDLGFRLETLDEARLSELRAHQFPYDIDPAWVNSVFHPRLTDLTDPRF